MMKTLLTYFFTVFALSAFSQENQELSWNIASASSASSVTEKISEKAISNATLLEKCCGEYINNHTVCLQDMPANYLGNIIANYPQGFSEETIKDEEATTIKYIYVNNGEVKTLEKKTWNWGGEFYYKNYLCPITAQKFLEELESLMEN